MSICTTPQQGFELARMGADCNHADMWWSKYRTGTDLELVTYKISKGDVPAWTLTSLFKMISPYIEYEDSVYRWMFTHSGIEYTLKYQNDTGEVLTYCSSSDPIETLFHVLCWMDSVGLKFDDSYKYI